MTTREPSRACIVLITGLPGAGKSTIGRRISERLGLVFITKDVFKELIFDGLGWSDKAWSLKVSATSYRIMDYVIEEELKARHSIVVESNFKPDVDSARFRDLQARHDAALVQVLCWAQGDVLFDRYERRVEADRHPGHVERASLEAARRDLSRGKGDVLQVDGPTLEIDTTDFAGVDYAALVASISAHCRA